MTAFNRPPLTEEQEEKIYEKFESEWPKSFWRDVARSEERAKFSKEDIIFVSPGPGTPELAAKMIESAMLLKKQMSKTPASSKEFDARLNESSNIQPGTVSALTKHFGLHRTISASSNPTASNTVKEKPEDVSSTPRKK